MTQHQEKKKIGFVRVELDDDYDDFYFAEAANVCIRLGNHVTVYQSSINERRGISKNNLYKPREIAAWIPRSIFGCLRKPMYVLRSVVTALQVAWLEMDKETEIMFVEANCAALPILKLIGRCKIISFEYYRELLSDRHPPEILRGTVLPPECSFRCFCMRFVDRLLVPSEGSRSSFLVRHGYGNPPEVLYAPAYMECAQLAPEVELPMPLTPEFKFTYLACEILDYRAYLPMLIYAFEHVLERTEDECKNGIHLIIIGYFDSSIPNQVHCRNQLLDLINCSPYANQIHLLCNVDLEVKARIYSRCQVVLNVTDKAAHSQSIMDAFYFGRPVVSICNGLAMEVIRHNINGYLVDSDSYSFSDAMYYLLQGYHVYGCTGMLAASYYETNFSGLMYTRRLQALLQDL